MTAPIEPVVQPEISDQSVTEIVKEDEIVETMPNDFKKDFFKHKQQMKDAQNERDSMAAKLRMFEEEDNVRKGNLQAVIDTLKSENAELRGTLDADLKARRIDKLDRALIKKATAMGFSRPDDVKRFLSADERKLLVIDEDFNIDDYGLNKAMEGVKNNWGDLFKQNKIVIADGNPTTNLNAKPPKDVNKMSTEERMELILKQTKK